MKKTLLTSLILLSLSGCGGSGGSGGGSNNNDSDNDNSNEGSNPPVTQPEEGLSINGVVADGYLENAVVCLDTNKDDICDSETALTNKNGQFEIKNLEQSDIDNGRLIVDIISGQTLDADDNGAFKEHDYRLYAPAGYTFVSPLTTLVDNMIETETGVTLKEAEDYVEAQTGLNVNLNNNFVEESKTNQDYAKLYQISQVVNDLIENPYDQVVDIENGKEWLYSRTLNNLVKVSKGILENKSLNEIYEFVSVPLKDAKLLVEMDSKFSKIMSDDASSLLKNDSLFILNNSNLLDEGKGFYFGIMESSYASLQNGYFDHLSRNNEWNKTQKQWVKESNFNNYHNFYYLTDQGWKNNVSYSLIEGEDDQIKKRLSSNSEIGYSEYYEKIDLSGVNVKDYLKYEDALTFSTFPWLELTKENQVFPDGSVSYKAKEVASGELFLSYGSGSMKFSDANKENLSEIVVNKSLISGNETSYSYFSIVPSYTFDAKYDGLYFLQIYNDNTASILLGYYDDMANIQIKERHQTRWSNISSDKFENVYKIEIPNDLKLDLLYGDAIPESLFLAEIKKSSLNGYHPKIVSGFVIPDNEIISDGFISYNEEAANLLQSNIDTNKYCQYLSDEGISDIDFPCN